MLLLPSPCLFDIFNIYTYKANLRNKSNNIIFMVIFVLILIYKIEWVLIVVMSSPFADQTRNINDEINKTSECHPYVWG